MIKCQLCLKDLHWKKTLLAGFLRFCDNCQDAGAPSSLTIKTICHACRLEKNTHFEKPQRLCPLCRNYKNGLYYVINHRFEEDDGIPYPVLIWNLPNIPEEEII